MSLSKMNISQELRQQLFSILIVCMFVSFICFRALYNIIGVLFILMFFFDEWKNVKDKLKTAYQSKIIWLFITLFLAQLIGLFYSDNQEFALKRIQIFIPILYLPLVLKTEHLSSKYLYKILTSLKLIIPFIFIILFLFQIFILKRNLNTFVNFTVNEYLGISQFYLIFILIIPIIESARQAYAKKDTILNVFLLCLNLFSVFLLSNKTIFLFLIIVAFILIFKMFKSDKKKAVLFMIGIVSIIVLAMQLNVVNNKIDIFLKTTDFDLETIITKNKFAITKNTVEHRVLINYVSIQAISEALPFGYGTGDYTKVLLEGYKNLNFKAGIYSGYNTHNQYFEEFLKTGIIGGGIFIMLMFFLMKKIYFNNPYSIVVFFFVFACFFESYLYRQHGVAIFSFIIPFLIFNTNKLVINNHIKQ